MKAAGAICSLALLAGCSSSDAPEPAPASLGVDFDIAVAVEWAGCAALSTQPLVCELTPERGLRLWIEAPAEATLRIEGGAAELERLAEGTRARVVVREGASALKVVAEREGAEAHWTLSVRDAVARAWLDDARRLRKAGELEAAEAALAGAPVADAAWVRGMRGRLALSAGDMPRAVELLEGSAARHLGAGRLSEGVNDTLAQAFVLRTYLGELTAAREALAALEPALASYPEGRARAAYYAGLVALDGGNLRQALADFEGAALAAERLGMRWVATSARKMGARTLTDLGRYAEAGQQLLAVLADLGPESATCERASAHHFLGWTRLAAGDLEAALAALKLARAAYAAGEGCAQPSEALDAALDEAQALLALGRVGEASAALEDALQAPGAGPLARFWMEDLGGRLALARGDAARALAVFESLSERVRAGGEAELVWRAELGRARAAEALGRREVAVAALERAERALDARTGLIPLGAGRDVYLGEREASARMLVELLVREGRAAEALSRAREARVRVLARVRHAASVEGLSAGQRARWEARVARYRQAREALSAALAEDWGRPAEELERLAPERAAKRAELARLLDAAFDTLGAPEVRLAPPAAGELLVAHFPTREGWVVFGATSDAVVATPIAGPEVSELMRGLDALLARAERVRVLTYGATHEVDFAALAPLSGVPLVYGQDLGARPGSGARAGHVIVADPERDLPAAGEEADAVAAVQAFDTRLEGDVATRQRVLGALEGAALFHYAGHGVVAGRGGWDSGLPLADDTRISVGDVLALAEAPRVVVLSACETARLGSEGPAAGVGLAHAFVAAGSEAVVATARPVADGLAKEMSAALYAALGAQEEVDVARALASAQAEIKARRPGWDWAAYRVLVP